MPFDGPLKRFLQDRQREIVDALVSANSSDKLTEIKANYLVAVLKEIAGLESNYERWLNDRAQKELEKNSGFNK